MAAPVPVLSRMYVLLSFPPNTLLAESPAVQAISMKSAIAGGLLVAEIVCSLSVCVAASRKTRKTANRIQPRTHSDPLEWLRARLREFSSMGRSYLYREYTDIGRAILSRLLLSPANV